MKLPLAILAVLAAASVMVPVLAGEPQPGMPPALLEAIAGKEPYCSLVEQGMPLLNTTDEVAALPQDVRVARAVAIKKVLLAQKIRSREERYRITPENYAEGARLAAELGAPKVLRVYYELLAGGELSTRASYAVQEALRQLYRDYLVDVTALHYFVSGSHLAAAELRAAAEWLPMAGLFNAVQGRTLTREKVTADFRSLLDVLPTLTALYAGVQDSATAEAAWPQLLPLLVQFEATTGARYHAEPEQVNQAMLQYGAQIDALYTTFAAERRRLQEANYFDNIPLRVVDYLIH